MTLSTYHNSLVCDKTMFRPVREVAISPYCPGPWLGALVMCLVLINRLLDPFSLCLGPLLLEVFRPLLLHRLAR